ncbi:MAG: two-component regulator propeller domain-containing protein, partial [Saprospiraceae bacterium]
YNGTHFTLFTTKDGLPDNTANCVTEDATGNIWFGTENGVSRFDGMRFSNFTEEDGLNDHFINAILKDKNGKIWIGTNKGMNCYNGKSFTNFTDRDHFPPQKVASLFEDSKNNIWIGCNATQAGGKGLCRFDGKSLHYSIRPYFVMYLCEDKNKALWFAHNKGAEHPNFALYRYDGNSFSTITQQNQIDNPVIFGIIEDNKGSIWFGTSKGVCRYDGTWFNYFRKKEDR